VASISQEEIRLLAFFDVLGINEFTVESEVLPLAVHGTAKVNDRLYNVVTKGGLVGNVEALYDIVNYLESLMKESKPMRKIIAIPLGDVAGIGPEIVVKSLNDREIYDTCKPLVIGHSIPLQKAMEVSGVALENKQNR